MNKLFYPAIFHKAEEGGFWVSFPDIPECLTEEAMALEINFSQVLQEALIAKINSLRTYKLRMTTKIIRSLYKHISLLFSKNTSNFSR